MQLSKIEDFFDTFGHFLISQSRTNLNTFFKYLKLFIIEDIRTFECSNLNTVKFDK